MRALLIASLLLLVSVEKSAGQGRLNADLDKFGNPVGAHGLASDGAFRGKHLLMWGGNSGPEPIFTATNPLLAMLRKKGFVVQVRQRTFDPGWLRDADQLWLFSGMSSVLTAEDVEAIEAFVKAGKGLYLVADNAPYTAEAHQIGNQLFGVAVEGNYIGQNTIAVRQALDQDPSDRGTSRTDGGPPKKTSKEEVLDKLPGLGATIQNSQVSHFVPDHALLTGINFIYEGSTISHLTPNNQLETVLVASDGQILASVAKDKRRRVIVDCGYTRYFPQFINDTAGTLRYAENVAAFLMGVESEKPLSGLSVSELLEISANADNAKRRVAALRELTQRQPAYADVKDEIEAMCRYLQSDDLQVKQASREQLALAFQQAPIPHCLYWIAQDKPGLSDLIWQQIDNRIARADPQRRESYHDLAIKVVRSDKFETPSRLAAIQLLLRLKNPASLIPLIDSLIELPRELWPTAGSVLEELSGENFGPEAGDRLADVVSISRKWKAWLKDQP